MVPTNSTIIDNNICNSESNGHQSLNFHINRRKVFFLKKLGLGLWKEIPHAQSATALHFLISKRLGFLEEQEGPALLDASPTGTIGTSESKVAIVLSNDFDRKTNACFDLDRLNKRMATYCKIPSRPLVILGLWGLWACISMLGWPIFYFYFFFSFIIHFGLWASISRVGWPISEGVIFLFSFIIFETCQFVLCYYNN